MPAFIQRHNYILLLIVAALVGHLLPAYGARDGVLQLGRVTTWGIMLVFFLHGANLSPRSLRDGASRWRLHLMIQSYTFIAFPLVGAAVFLLGRGWLPDDLLLGFFYLCVLSTTISSAVAMTAMAGGNVAAAVFNATLSGLLGMVITPVLTGLVISLSGDGLDYGEAILNVVRMLLVPFLAGQLLRPLLHQWLARFKSPLSWVDKIVIALIVLSAFSDSARSGAWSSYPPLGMATLLLMVVVLLLLATWGALRWARWARLSREDEVTLLYCGSQKSLANGMPIANVILAGNPAFGVIVLPMIVYHQLQLLMGSWLAQRYVGAAGKAPPDRS